MSQTSNLEQAVPFFTVKNMEASVRFYVHGLGFTMTKHWVVDGQMRWCFIEREKVAFMLQSFISEGPHNNVPKEKLGVGVSICIFCQDALAIYREVVSRGVESSRPFVGNGMWVVSLTDPDGYRIDFESYTDVPEDTVLLDEEHAQG